MTRIDRLAPVPASDVDLASCYRVERPTPRDRPWVMVGMIQSIDGAIEVDGTSGGLGNVTDRRVLHTLREIADVILVGAHSVAVEGYGPPRKPGQRIGVVTNSGRLDYGSDLFARGAGFVITHESATVPAGIDTVRAGTSRLDVAAALARLGSLIDASIAICEGGPSLNASLLAAGLVDELCITTAPLLIGGSSPRIVGRGPAVTERFTLAHLLIDTDGYQFHRWLGRVSD